MDKPGRILLFADVVNCGSFTKAADLRQITRSMISKQINHLEEELNARLFNRTTRSLSLTEIGELVFQQASKLKDHLDQMESLVASYQNKVSGQLKISTATHFGPLHIQPVVDRFIKDYPDVSMELYLENRMVNIVSEGFDLAVRIANPKDSNLIARKLADNNVVIVASPGYLATHGKPARMSQLLEHKCVVYSAEGVIVDQWHFKQNGKTRSIKVKSIYRTNDGNILIQAIKKDIGIGLIPTFMIGDAFREGSLVPILDQVQLVPYSPLYAMYPSRQYLPPKVQIFLKYLTDYIGTPPFWDKY